MSTFKTNDGVEIYYEIHGEARSVANAADGLVQRSSETKC